MNPGVAGPIRAPAPHVEHKPMQCWKCNKTFTASRCDAKFCSLNCRMKAWRGRVARFSMGCHSVVVCAVEVATAI